MRGNSRHLHKIKAASQRRLYHIHINRPQKSECYNHPKMINVKLLGHAAVLVKGSKTVIVDPYISGNPASAVGLDDIPKTDFVLVTHDHADHFGDAIQIAKRDNATLIAIHEIATGPKVTESGILSVGMNIGGTYEKDGVSFSMTPAVHSSSLGAPCGFVIGLDGKRIYHSGDTALFSDMKLIPELFGPLDLALLPIGGHYGMDKRQAVMAAKLINPKLVIPMHYGTWEVISAAPDEFAAEGEKEGIKTISLKFGESIDLD